MIETGLKHSSELTVTENVTAMVIVKDCLPEGCTTVGGHIESSHLKPSKIGDVVRAEAEVTKVDGKKIEFKVAAYSGQTLLGEGTHLRFIVDQEKFMARIG